MRRCCFIGELGSHTAFSANNGEDDEEEEEEDEEDEEEEEEHEEEEEEEEPIWTCPWDWFQWAAP